VAAVLAAGFARGGFCGALVLVGGGIAGLALFAGWDGSLGTAAAPLVSLAFFWAVGALVLMTANELRRHADRTFHRLQKRVRGAASEAGETSGARRAA
jgi:hypothetical protein